jgi:thiol-disulfide isomerase/thioredoxin
MLKTIILITLFITSNIAFTQDALRPWIGVQIEHSMLGVLIGSTYPDTPAAKAGFVKGDTILFIDGEKVSTPAQLIKIVGEKGVGNKVTIKYLDTKNQEKETVLKLATMPGISKLAEKKLMNKKLPKFDLALLSKSKLKSYDIEKNIGKVKIIKFWATWCGACKMAQKPVHEFAKKYKDTIEVITVSSENNIKLKKYFAKISKTPYFSESVLYLHDKDGAMSNEYLVPALPMFLVVDKNNVVQFLTMGIGENLKEAFEKAIELTK